jgi:hypothetical protein
VYDNPEIMIIQYLGRVVPSPEVFLFVEKSFISVTGRSQEHVQKGLPRVRSFSSMISRSIDW